MIVNHKKRRRRIEVGDLVVVSTSSFYVTRGNYICAHRLNKKTKNNDLIALLIIARNGQGKRYVVSHLVKDVPITYIMEYNLVYLLNHKSTKVFHL